MESLNLSRISPNLNIETFWTNHDSFLNVRVSHKNKGKIVAFTRPYIEDNPEKILRDVYKLIRELLKEVGEPMHDDMNAQKAQQAGGLLEALGQAQGIMPGTIASILQQQDRMRMEYERKVMGQYSPSIQPPLSKRHRFMRLHKEFYKEEGSNFEEPLDQLRLKISRWLGKN